jgi:very-short-patch-repair endonuclease
MTTIETLPYRLNLDYFFIYLTVVLLFVFFAAFVRLKRSNQIVLSYSAVSRLFSPAELSFYHNLKQAFSSDYEIFGKVRIADVIQPEKKLNHRLRRIALNKVAQKHFDYVICDPKTLSIIAVIELDDKSHDNEKTIRRDDFVNEACKSAGIKLIRFKAKSGYQIQDIRDVINTAIGSS